MGRFSRQTGSKKLRRKVFVAAEGSATEWDYLDFLQDIGCETVKRIKPQTSKSNPRNVLQRMKEGLKGNLQKNDEAWILIDRDEWSETEIEPLLKWERKDPRYHVVISNPCVEFWLLLHFEDGGGATTPEMCRNRLKKYLPDYKKRILLNSFTEDMVQGAISRARRLCEDKGISWDTPCSTTFHQFVQSLLSARS